MRPAPHRVRCSDALQHRYPIALNMALPWYSWMFMVLPTRGQGGPSFNTPDEDSIGGEAFQGGRLRGSVQAVVLQVGSARAFAHGRTPSQSCCCQCSTEPSSSRSLGACQPASSMKSWWPVATVFNKSRTISRHRNTAST